jgi:hypothetical protein
MEDLLPEVSVVLKYFTLRVKHSGAGSEEAEDSEKISNPAFCLLLSLSEI